MYADTCVFSNIHVSPTGCVCVHGFFGLQCRTCCSVGTRFALTHSSPAYYLSPLLRSFVLPNPLGQSGHNYEVVMSYICDSCTVQSIGTSSLFVSHWWSAKGTCVAVCCSALHCVAVYCSVYYIVAVCCRVLHCVAVCCSVLQCVTVWCNVLQRVAVWHSALQ